MKKTPKDKTITLCMIVKNETHIVKECLESMLPYIDRYDVTDTGSDDGTPELIEQFMEEHGIPGEVYRSDWKGFGDHAGNIGSRTESLRNCDGKADYAWVIDADDYISGDFNFPENMDADAYSLRLGRDDFSWWRTQIFKTGISWKYVGVLHEYAECGGNAPPKTDKVVGEYSITARTEGARNVGITTKEKYSKDAIQLEEALENEPDNSRYQFYLAQSYFDSQQYEKSLEAYSKRTEMGGWEEEVYYSYFRVAILNALLDKTWPEIQQAFLNAYDYRPSRAEPLYQIARLYRQVHDKPKLAYVFARMALEIPYPENDILFISDDVYRWQVLDEVAATAYYAGKPHVGYHACKRLLDDNLVPEEHRQRTIDNFKQYEEIVMQIQSHVTQNELAKKAEEKDLKRQNKIEKRTTEKKSTKINKNNNSKKRKK
jgi:glycosyltransferase involved in cell wall biosynthesis|tara:strand:+ start:5987 stop:7276 length:1290 start_codon:yes stop_codon:yes gene_type:complete